MTSDDLKQRALELFQQAHELQMRGQLAQAENAYKQSIDLFPTAEAHTFLGWTYSQMGRLDEAIDQCHLAIRTDPSFGNPYNDIGAYLMQQGKVDEAVPWFEQALEAPRYESYCYPYLNLGRAHEIRRRYREALTCYRQAVRERPDYPPAHQGVARICALMN